MNKEIYSMGTSIARISESSHASRTLSLRPVNPRASREFTVSLSILIFPEIMKK
jgi:hypothetical protein